MSLLQLPLDMLPGGSIAINDRLSMRICDDTLVYFHYLDPVYSHPFPDVAHRDRAIAMFLDFGTATASQLARAHGLSLRTVGRALKARRQGLHDSFPPPPAARARTVLKDPPQRQRARRHAALRQQLAPGRGRSRREPSNRVPLPPRRPPAWRARRARRRPAATGGTSRGQAPQAVSRSARNQLDAAAPLGMATCNVAGRMAASIGGPGPAPPRFEAVETVARGGVLTALPALLQAGLLSDRDRLGPVAGYYGQRAVLLLQAFLLLARVRNPERLRYEQPGEWGRLLGLDRSCAPDTLRRKLGELAGGEDAVQAWREQLARQWVSAAADDVATLFVDGHVQVYHGQANLPKHFVSRDRLKLPAAAGYWVHAPGGAPLLCLHQQVDPGMVAELRSAIVPQLEALGLLEPWLGAGQQEPRLTLAFDREGWSPQLFAALQARGIACVTWRKGPQQERWLDAEFRAAEIPLRTPFGEEIGRGCLAERAMSLLPSKVTVRVREIRFWINERQPPAGRSGQRRKARSQAGKPPAGPAPAIDRHDPPHHARGAGRGPAAVALEPGGQFQVDAPGIRSRHAGGACDRGGRGRHEGGESGIARDRERPEEAEGQVRSAAPPAGAAGPQEHAESARGAAEGQGGDPGGREGHRGPGTGPQFHALARAGRRAAGRAPPAGAARHPARPAGRPAHDRLPGRDRDGIRPRAASRQARGGARPGAGTAAVRREPAARPRSRHAHGAAAAHRLPGPRRGRRPTDRAAQPHQDHLSRHVPAARLRDPARPRPRKPIRAFQKLTLKCYENGKSGARELACRIEFCYTPKHGRWLNIAENELSAMTRQCLSGRRIGDLGTLQSEIAAWSTDVNDRQRGVDWRMTIADARCNLKSIYPKIMQ